MSEETWTTLKVLEWTTERFVRAGIDTARLDAQVLLAHVLSCQRVQLYTSFDKPLGPDELAAYRGLVKQRLAGQPVAYLVGEQEFWSLPLHVDPGVLIPRRDTETVIEVILRAIDEEAAQLQAPAELEPAQVHQVDSTHAAAGASPTVTGELVYEMDEPVVDDWNAPLAGQAADERTERAGQTVDELASEPRPRRGRDREPGPGKSARRAALRIADIATGSGAIAIALATELPNARVVATDISARAVEMAQRNALHNQVGERLDVRTGDLFEPVGGLRELDVIVSNPPYIPTAHLEGLSAEVRCEPRLALDGGVDGLVLLRRIVTLAPVYLAPRGLLAVEHGHDQADAVASFFAQTGAFEPARMQRDLGGNPRVTYARLASPRAG